ncbi:type II toxin-antitoxin system prevent-host-death family antitoxin [Mycobacterium vicinigordonae]|uniref:Antitoxin n=1 Tax=Mycobacterium vicinigordonae TaxID=1719132 RepID=A0A7D6DXD1_9MYCO|nr:type II toxin-antitoxin system prevent-host-death family antitoxin [Mycobacterium vicinigordonae]QLL07127.1 type II toxin-antitoxin system prevent-host-death family antitoxin [Mycobacterium vicinigordonae]
MMIPISKAKAKLSELVRHSQDEDVLLMNHSEPAAIIIGAARYDSMRDEIEDLRDRLSVHERTGVTISASKLRAELGLAGDS